ncbi:MAG: guanylate kinase [Actinobacteria bacterium]|nr:MAG: guanylate kinase [Actinomycetota bacterium]
MSGPSGVGKGTVVRRLLQLKPELVYSVSCTTRDPRPGEVDGRDYRFVPRRAFDELIEDGAFLEWAEVYGHHRSGTLRAPVVAELEAGRDVILEIDVQGAATVRGKMPEAVLVFLAPPSKEELARRLRARHTESEGELALRLAAAQGEMEESGWFDYVVVNDDVDRAAAEVAAIIDGNPDR